jgi:outer membrane protein assembly factor BamE (lipoprotein component of BamABCDE complex)
MFGAPDPGPPPARGFPPGQTFGGNLLCAAIGAALLMAAGCGTPMLLNYLQEGQDRVTQEQVRKDLGEPVAIFPDEGGQSRWIYRHLVYSQNPPFGVSSCVEYNLIFDKDRILRRWTIREWPPTGC